MKKNWKEIHTEEPKINIRVNGDAFHVIIKALSMMESKMSMDLQSNSQDVRLQKMYVELKKLLDELRRSIA